MMTMAEYLSASIMLVVSGWYTPSHLSWMRLYSPLFSSAFKPSLNFASKEEEYHYELDRNDTHQMLVTVLLEEKMADSAGVAKMVNVFLDKARLLREEGDRQAARGDFEAAVQTLEESTKELVRAIRSGGIYIPG